MKTKLSISVILLGAIIMLGLQSCKKYPEGPVISLRTKTERVANTWKVDNYKINSSDYTSFMSDYDETFTKEGDYSYSWGSLDGTGKWAFQNDKEQIKLTGIDNQASHDLTILKLEEKSFWYYYMDGNDKHEVHLIPK